MSRVSGFSSQRGFSLLEVLLAGFILFLVLSSMTLVYRGAILSSAKAESAITFTSSIMPIKQLVADRLRVQGGETLSGEGRYGNLNYVWSGKITHRGYYRLPDDPSTRVTYTLARIDMRVIDGGMVRDYAFSEFIW